MQHPGCGGAATPPLSWRRVVKLVIARCLWLQAQNVLNWHATHLPPTLRAPPAPRLFFFFGFPKSLAVFEFFSTPLIPLPQASLKPHFSPSSTLPRRLHQTSQLHHHQRLSTASSRYRVSGHFRLFHLIFNGLFCLWSHF